MRTSSVRERKKKKKRVPHIRVPGTCSDLQLMFYLWRTKCGDRMRVSQIPCAVDWSWPIWCNINFKSRELHPRPVLVLYQLSTPTYIPPQTAIAITYPFPVHTISVAHALALLITLLGVPANNHPDQIPDNWCTEKAIFAGKFRFPQTWTSDPIFDLRAVLIIHDINMPVVMHYTYVNIVHTYVCALHRKPWNPVTEMIWINRACVGIGQAPILVRLINRVTCSDSGGQVLNWRCALVRSIWTKNLICETPQVVCETNLFIILPCMLVSGTPSFYTFVMHA
jgi:hypothetical protein